MVKNKLWRFGDSYSKTEDRDFGDIELNHSVYISEHFNMELVHLGDGGMSNLEIFQRILSNKDEVKRISDQLLSKKLIEIFKSNLKFKNNKVSYEKFIEMAYSKN